MDTKPAKLFKVGGYLLDPTGRLDANMIRSKIAYGCGYPFVTHYLNVQQEKVREISEDHPLMDENCSLSDCEKYFSQLSSGNRRPDGRSWTDLPPFYWKRSKNTPYSRRHGSTRTVFCSV